MGSGLKTKLTGMVFIPTLIMLGTAAIGRTTNSMAKARKLGLMVLSTKASTLKEKSMEKELFSLVMDPNTMEISNIMTSTVMGSTNGLMVKSMKETGSKTKCMVKAKSSGKMAVNTKVNINTIKNTATVSSSGMMEENMKATGKMESNTEKVYI